MSINIEQLYDKACDLYNQEEYEKAFSLFLDLAEKNDPDAQNDVAEMYYSGIGVAKNELEALKWWEKAVKQGNCDSFYELGKVKITKGESEEGIRLIELASKQFHLDSMYQMAGYYYYGKYINKDTEKAIRLYEELSKKGYKDATHDYLSAIFNEYGTKKALIHVLKLLLKRNSWKFK